MGVCMSIGNARPPVAAACPSCGAFEEFRSARAIHEAGTHHLDGRFVGGGAGLLAGAGPAVALGGGSVRGVQRSALAARLAPPIPPCGPRPAGEEDALGGGPAVLAGVLFVVLMGPALAAAGAVLRALDLRLTIVQAVAAAAVACGAVCVAAAAALARARRRARLRERLRRAEQWDEWDAARELWDRLWYCLRCGRETYVGEGFAPGRREVPPPGEGPVSPES